MGRRSNGYVYAWVCLFHPDSRLTDLSLSLSQAAIFHKEDVRFTAGRENLVYWSPSEVSQEYILPCKVSCRTCRSPIMDEGRNMLLLFPTLVRFEDAKQRRLFQPR